VYKERLDRSERELASFQERMATRSTFANPVNTGNVNTGLHRAILKALEAGIAACYCIVKFTPVTA